MKKRYHHIIFVLALLFQFCAQAQIDSSAQVLNSGTDSSVVVYPDSKKPKDYILIDDSLDITYVSFLEEVLLVDFKPLSKAEKRDYYRLRRKVLKVYPYALEASKLFVEVTTTYQELNKRRKKKRYTRKKEKWVKETFSTQLKKLTRSEGRILIKLINRNTQITTHELIKTYRGGLTAFFWQRMAKFYDSDLKMVYSPETKREDQLIEMIIQKAIQAQLIEESKLSPYQIQPYLDAKGSK